MSALTSLSTAPDPGEKLVAPAHLTADAVDRALQASTIDAVSRVTLDLRGVTQVDSTGAMFLVACLATLADRGVDLGVYWPQSQRALERLLTRYRFDEALRAVLSAPTPPPDAARAERPWEGRTRKTLNALAAIRVVRDPTIDDALNETDRWAQPDVRSVVETRLGRKAHLLAPGIVFEAYANAVMHPEAELVLTSGHFDFRKTATYPKGSLTLAFWDNGQSITSTLRGGLERHEIGTREEFELYHQAYAVSHRGSDEIVRIHSGEELPTDAPDPELLLFATFPGVTSDPEGERSDASGSSDGIHPPGMGLFVLTSLAVDSFGGEVTIRTESANAHFRMAPPSVRERYDCRYRVTVNGHQARPYFSGNHLVVRLPLAA